MTGRRVSTWQQDIKDASKKFEERSLLEAVKRQAANTYGRMKSNKGSYTTKGDFVSGKGWWSVPEFTSDPVRLETRGQALRDKVYEHSIFDLLTGLQDQNILTLSADTKKLVTEATTPGIINNLMNLTRADGPGANISLTKAGELYGYSPGFNGELVRDNKIVPLCKVGILSAKYNQTWAISLGPVAEIFYLEVYFPLINETSINGEKIT